MPLAFVCCYFAFSLNHARTIKTTVLFQVNTTLRAQKSRINNLHGQKPCCVSSLLQEVKVKQRPDTFRTCRKTCSLSKFQCRKIQVRGAFSSHVFSKGRKRVKDSMKVIKHCPFIMESIERLHKHMKKALEQMKRLMS